MCNKLAETIEDAFWTDAEEDVEGNTPANIADGLFAISRSIHHLATVLQAALDQPKAVMADTTQNPADVLKQQAGQTGEKSWFEKHSGPANPNVGGN